MPHDKDTSHWHEPAGHKRAGYGEFKKQPTPYDAFMQEEGQGCRNQQGTKFGPDALEANWRERSLHPVVWN